MLTMNMLALTKSCQCLNKNFTNTLLKAHIQEFTKTGSCSVFFLMETKNHKQNCGKMAHLIRPFSASVRPF